MERRLRIRIEHIPAGIDDVVEEFTVTDLDAYFTSKIHGHSNNIVIMKSVKDRSKFDINHEAVNFIHDFFDFIAVVDIHLNTDHENEDHAQSSLLPQHGFILNAARSIYRKYDNIGEMIRVTDHKDKSVKILTSPNIYRVGSPYRLYIDDQMITEKFYPYSLSNHQQIEENISVNLSMGTHRVRLESLGKNNLKINGFACDDMMRNDISVSELSFQIL